MSWNDIVLGPWLELPTKIHKIIFDSDGKIKSKSLPNERSCRPMRVKTGRQNECGRRGLRRSECCNCERIFRARRRQAAYMKKWSMCLMITPITLILTNHMPNKRKKLKIVAPKDFLNFVIPGHLTKIDVIFGKKDISWLIFCHWVAG